MSSLSTTIEIEPDLVLAPVHPGEVLREEFLKPNRLSAGALARAIGVPRTRVERLVNEKVELSPDTALRLARFFGTSAEFWMSIQTKYALDTVSADISEDLERIEQYS